MDITKRYGDVEVTLEELPTIGSALYHEVRYQWLDERTDDYVSGSIGIQHGKVIDFDGCDELPEEITRTLTNLSFTI